MLVVALDATPLLGSRTGIGVAVDGFVRHLARRSDLGLIGFGLTARGRRALAAALPPGVTAAGRPVPASVMLRVWSRSRWPSAESWTGPVSVVHGTNYVLPPPRRAAGIVTVWDMSALHYPQLCTPTTRRYPALIAAAVARGAWVHTGSQSVADELADHFAVGADRIRVVPPGIEVPAERPERPAGSGRRYVLGLGRSEPRKDFPTLVRAFDLIAGERPDLDLELAGPPGWAEAELAAAISAARYRDRIHRVGWVDQPQRLLAGAAAFAYPSLYEGFGLPPLEAMAMGVPVVAARAGAVPEVTGDAARLVPTRDPVALAEALARVLDDPAEAARLAAAGPARAAGFDWTRSAAAMADLYRDAAGAG